MIDPKKASELIRRHTPKPVSQRTPLARCLGRVLAEDVTAPFAMPIADNSAMDGFVIRTQDAARASAAAPVTLQITGAIRAGDTRRTWLRAGTAARIMTGALIPSGGGAVIPKEDAVINGHSLVITAPARDGRHIRRRGEEIPKDARLLKKGMTLQPAAIGVLASCGFPGVRVYASPRVAVLATGTELVTPGIKLKYGQIYDSNSWMMRAALRQMGIDGSKVMKIPDDAARMRQAVRSALASSEILLLLGGVSVGDYDLVKDALTREGVQTIFWKVSQKPGKPLFFGRKGKKLVFGLPGNPAAVFTCFYEYVYPALRRFMGAGHAELDRITVRVKGPVPSDSQKQYFLKAQLIPSNAKDADVSGGCREAQVAGRQGSHMISSLADADGFLIVPPGGPAQKGVYQMDLLPHDGRG
jgi:molybdopterin molybdotransferase